jgi:hypothetical protein
MDVMFPNMVSEYETLEAFLIDKHLPFQLNIVNYSAKCTTFLFLWMKKIFFQ